MSQHMRVMVVDDERAMRESLAAWLAKEGHEASAVASGGEALARLGRENWDLVLADVKMPGMDGGELLRKIKEDHPDVLVVMITAYGSIESAVEAMKQGASDYLLKPFDPEQLILLVGKLARHRSLVRENLRLKERLHQLELSGGVDLLAESAPMRKLLGMIQDLAATDAAVLIYGETGTGKELVARALHGSGSRAYGPFVPINCGAQNENLLESELFGHEKGAFTGAVQARRGRLELAEGGTLFLDEIGEIPERMQVDLLRVLEERRFQRVGGNQWVDCDFRLISATHRDLAAMTAAGKFRQDFFFRINVVSLEIPPLRERGADIGLLAEYFIDRYSRECGKPVSGLSPGALELLKAYRWPGNVRELKNVMERAVITCKQGRVGASELIFLRPRDEAGAAGLSLQDAEISHINMVLAMRQGNISQAARVLGIDRRTLSRKLKRYGIAKGG